MDDTIFRRAAIEAVNGVLYDFIPGVNGRYEDLPFRLTRAIMQLPCARSKWEGLKPCPFCGGDASFVACGEGEAYVKCTECGVETKVKPSYLNAVEAWNRRASDG